MQKWVMICNNDGPISAHAFQDQCLHALIIQRLCMGISLLPEDEAELINECYGHGTQHDGMTGGVHLQESGEHG